MPVELCLAPTDADKSLSRLLQFDLCWLSGQPDSVCAEFIYAELDHELALSDVIAFLDCDMA